MTREQIRRQANRLHIEELVRQIGWQVFGLILKQPDPVELLLSIPNSASRQRIERKVKKLIEESKYAVSDSQYSDIF